MHLFPLQRENSILGRLTKKAQSDVNRIADGSSGNDTLLAPAGRNAYDAGLGHDTVVLPNGRGSYDIKSPGLMLTVRDNHGMELQLKNVEELRFLEDGSTARIAQHYFHLDVEFL